MATPTQAPISQTASPAHLPVVGTMTTQSPLSTTGLTAAPSQISMPDRTVAATQTTPSDQVTTSNTKDKEMPPAYDAVVPPLAPRFQAEDFQNDGKVHVLIGASEAIFMWQFKVIIKSWEQFEGVSVRVVLTAAAVQHLAASGISLEQIRESCHCEGVYTDTDQWSIPEAGITLVHELGRWVDVMLIAPLDPGTFGKICNGLTDNLLTSLVRDWDHTGSMNPEKRSRRPKFLILSLIMNRAMSNHPLTQQQLKTFSDQKWRSGFGVLPCTKCACAHSLGGNIPKDEPWVQIFRSVVIPRASASPQRPESVRVNGEWNGGRVIENLYANVKRHQKGTLRSQVACTCAPEKRCACRRSCSEETWHRSLKGTGVVCKKRSD